MTRCNRCGDRMDDHQDIVTVISGDDSLVIHLDCVEDGDRILWSGGI